MGVYGCVTAEFTRPRAPVYLATAHCRHARCALLDQGSEASIVRKQAVKTDRFGPYVQDLLLADQRFAVLRQLQIERMFSTNTDFAKKAAMWL